MLTHEILVVLILQANDSGLASYVAGQIDRSLSWKVEIVFPIFRFLKLYIEVRSSKLNLDIWTGCQVASDNHYIANSGEGCNYC